MNKLIRITTIPISLEKLLEDQGRFFSAHYKITFVSSDATKLKSVANQQGVHHFSVEMTRKITPLKDLSSLLQLYHFLRKEKPEIVHTHTPKAGIVGMLAAFFAGVPIRLHTVAGLPLMEANGFKKQVLLAVERLTYRCATKVYPNSEGLLQYIKEKRLAPKNKLKVIGKGSSNGIDTDYFDPIHVSEEQRQALEKEFTIQSQDLVFCFVGRLVGDKGIHELVTSFIEVHQKNPATALLLVGPQEQTLDPLQQETLAQIQNHPKIITTGYQQDVRPFLNRADIFTFPSYREGFPNVVLQAGAMGVPCIVSDINGCNEIIQDNQNGYLVPIKNTSKLTEKMEKLANNPSLRKEFADKNKAKIQRDFKRKAFWQMLLKEYQLQEKCIQ